MIIEFEHSGKIREVLKMICEKKIGKMWKVRGSKRKNSGKDHVQVESQSKKKTVMHMIFAGIQSPVSKLEMVVNRSRKRKKEDQKSKKSHGLKWTGKRTISLALTRQMRSAAPGCLMPCCGDQK